MRISIPQPCHEKWSEMTPNEKGAFCGVCSKTVVDFTTMSDEQVKNYFIDNAGQKTCGRFRNEQLTNEHDELKNVMALSIPPWKKIAAAIFILFGSLLTSCESSTIKGKAVQPVDRVTIVGGALEIPIGTTDKPLPPPPTIKTVTIETTTTGIIEEPPVLMGEIIAEPMPPVPQVDTVTLPVPQSFPLGKVVVDPPKKKECNDKASDL